MSEMNVYELLYMSRMGDEFATEALFHRYAGFISKIVSVCIDSYKPLLHYRDDLLQEAQISLYKAVDCFRDDQKTSFKTFLAVVVKRKVWSVLRTLSREIQYTKDALPLDSMLDDDECMYSVVPSKDKMMDPVYAMHYRIAQDNLKQTLKEMNDRERSILASYVNEESYTEAAERHGISIRSYDGRRFRLMRKVRKAVHSNNIR